MMEQISESLGLHKSAMTDVFEESYQRSLVVNYYPPCWVVDSDVTVGLPEHSDFSIHTVLLQDTPELEVLTKDGGWGLVKPIREALVVILADQMQILSNGKYQSPMHRATVNSEEGRVPIKRVHQSVGRHSCCTHVRIGLSRSLPYIKGRTYGAYKAAFAAQWKDKNALLKSATAATV